MGAAGNQLFVGHQEYGKQPDVSELFYDRRKPTNADVGSYLSSGGTLHGNLIAEGSVQAGVGYDVVSQQDIWAGRNIYESGKRVFSPNNHQPAIADGQSWIDVTTSRQLGATYTNTKGRPIQMLLDFVRPANDCYVGVKIDNVAFSNVLPHYSCGVHICSAGGGNITVHLEGALLMQYFKNSKNEVYAYDDDCDEKFIISGLISISENEALKLLAPPPPTKEELQAAAELKRTNLRMAADAEIAWRQDAADAGIATDDEVTALAAWKKYRVLLMRVNPANPVYRRNPE